MKRLLTLLALVLCSCAETFVGEEVARPNNENLPDLTATFADEEATRTYIEEGKYLRWNEDDRLTAFYGNTLNRQYKFNGATGDNSGTFSLVPSGELGTGNAIDHIYALYPYNADARITDEGVISLTLPAEQDYAENSFGRGANTMLAVTENLEDTFLAFKNVCGYLKLRLYNAEGATIKSIEVKGNSGERLAGAATATIAFGEAPVLAMADDATIYVTLNCGEGVALGTTAETATEFWVVLPATTFAEGLTITATDTEGGVFEKSTTNEVIIERNAIQPMAALEAECAPPGPADNEIWYTNGSTTEATTPYKTNAFGANIVSNTYNAEKEFWVIKFDSKVTSIGEDAFSGCDSLTSVTIPDSVTTIGNGAFLMCSSLTSMIIPDSVTTVEEKAFMGCRNLQSIKFGDGITLIGPNTFYNCSNLQEFKGKFASEDGRCLIINGVLNSIAPAGLTEYTIPNSVTEIGAQAFQYCSSLTSVTIPDSVTSIGYAAFYSCRSLTSVTIPDSVTTIGERAFEYCISLTSVTIPDSVTEIGESAFYGCTSLTRVTIPESVAIMGSGVFDSCENIIEFCGKFTSEDGLCIIINGTLDSFAFGGLEDHHYSIPQNVTTIGSSVFLGYSNLHIIYIPSNVTTIGSNAFGSSGLLDATIDSGVTTIGAGAFMGCYLSSVTIPDSVTTIGGYAFYDCRILTSVYCKATTPPVGDSYMFSNNASGRKIYVPMESVEAYKSAQGWSEYSEDIVAFDFEKWEIVPSTPKERFTVGDLVYVNGVAGIVYYTDEEIAQIISAQYSSQRWSSKDAVTKSRDADNGMSNMEAIKSISNWELYYPAFKWCLDLGELWYLPARNELKTIRLVKDTINATLRANGYETLDNGYYWSSTEYVSTNAYDFSFSKGDAGEWSDKGYHQNVRAVITHIY